MMERSSGEKEFLYRAKRIRPLGRIVHVCTQNENGPCPLLALANVLLLRNAIQMRNFATTSTSSSGGEESSSSPQLYSSHEVIATLATRILDSNVSEKTGRRIKGFS